jgi:hypothetical protein
LLPPCADCAFGSVEPVISARHEDDAARVASVVCRGGAAADLRVVSTPTAGWGDGGDRPAAALVAEPIVLVVITSSLRTWLSIPLAGCL